MLWQGYELHHSLTMYTIPLGSQGGGVKQGAPWLIGGWLPRRARWAGASALVVALAVEKTRTSNGPASALLQQLKLGLPASCQLLQLALYRCCRGYQASSSHLGCKRWLPLQQQVAATPTPMYSSQELLVEKQVTSWGFTLRQASPITRRRRRLQPGAAT